VKYLLVLLVVVGVLWLMSVQRRMSRDDDRDDAAPPVPPEPRAVVPIVACARCGMHLPEPEALRDGEHAYCGRTHQLLGPKRRPE
jgi:uncharacterized protein